MRQQVREREKLFSSVSSLPNAKFSFSGLSALSYCNIGLLVRGHIIQDAPHKGILDEIRSKKKWQTGHWTNQIRKAGPLV